MTDTEAVTGPAASTPAPAADRATGSTGRPAEPALGPYRAPVVVLALLVVLVATGLVLALVGAVRAPEGVSNSATVLGTFPADPGQPGIPPSVEDEEAAATTVAQEPAPGDAPPANTVPGLADLAIADAFDGEGPPAELTVESGTWTLVDGSLTADNAGPANPAVALASDPAAAIAAELGTDGGAVGLVLAWAGPGDYLAAVAAPGRDGWLLERHEGGEVVDEIVVAGPTGRGRVVLFGLAEGQAHLIVDGKQLGSIAVPAAGDRVGFLARGPAGPTFSARLEVPGA